MTNTKTKKNSRTGAPEDSSRRTPISKSGSRKPGDQKLPKNQTGDAGRGGPSEEEDRQERLRRLEDKVRSLINGDNKKDTQVINTTVEQRLQQVEDVVNGLISKQKKIPEPKYVTPRGGKAVLNGDLEKEIFQRFYQIELLAGTGKLSVDPYQVVKKIEEVTKKRPAKIMRTRTGFFVEVRDKEQGEEVVKIDRVKDVKCKVDAHPSCNQSQGIIYIYEFDVEDVNALKQELQKYNVVDVVKANWIKVRNEQTLAFLLTFNQEVLPTTIYIPGERSDTRVFPHVSKPMICKKCQAYGHTVKWCKNEVRCKQCGAEKHNEQQCTSREARCYHCGSQHRVGDKNCKKQIEEQLITEQQDKHKITRLRAIQMINGKGDTNSRGNQYVTHFKCETEPGKKRTVNPWLFEKELTDKLEMKPKSIRSESKSSFIIEVGSRRQSETIESIKEINGLSVTITKHPNYNTSKGIIYIYGYDMTDFNSYGCELMREINARDVVQATWIKPKNNRAKPLLVTFNQINPPEFVNIAGERALTEVRQYIPSPLRCNKCQEYGHTRKHCNGSEICGVCSNPGHHMSECQASEAKCHHCRMPHKTGDRSCAIHNYEKEIITIAVKENIPKQQARVVLNDRNPNFRMNFAEALRGREGATRDAAQQEERPKVGKTIQQKGAINIKKTTERETNMVAKEVTRDTERGKYITAEAVCVSPESGQMYTTTVEIPNRGEKRVVIVKTPTSENNAEVREEVREIFEQQMQEPEEKMSDDVQIDLDEYERELQRVCDERSGSAKPRKRKWSISHATAEAQQEEKRSNKQEKVLSNSTK